MAVEDGLSLGVVLSRGVKKSQVPDRLRLYEEFRKAHVRKIQDATRKYGWELDFRRGVGKTCKIIIISLPTFGLSLNNSVFRRGTHGREEILRGSQRVGKFIEATESSIFCYPGSQTVKTWTEI